VLAPTLRDTGVLVVVAAVGVFGVASRQHLQDV